MPTGWLPGVGTGPTSGWDENSFSLPSQLLILHLLAGAAVAALTQVWALRGACVG